MLALEVEFKELVKFTFTQLGPQIPHLSASSASPIGRPLKVMFMTEYHEAMRPLNRLNDAVISRADRLLQGGKLSEYSVWAKKLSTG